MTSLKFLSPENLFLLIPLVFLATTAFLTHLILRKRLSLFLSRYHAQEFSRFRSTAGWILKLSLLTIVLASLVLVISRPVLRHPAKHANFFLLIDLSRSMLVEDCQLSGQPCTRLEMTKIAAKKFIEELAAESRLGIGAFAGSGYRTKDFCLIRTYPQEVGSSREELIAMIDAIKPGQAWDSGTPIQLGLSELAGRIKEEKNAFGDNLTVIMITDGEENSRPYVYIPSADGDPPISGPDTSLPKIFISPDTLNDLKVKVLMVGVGTAAGGRIPEFDENWQFKGWQKDYGSDKEIVSRRDDDFLSALARKLGTDYLKLNRPEDLKKLANDPRYQTAITQSQKDLSQYVITAALILFLAALII